VPVKKKINAKDYEKALFKLQLDLVKLQAWIKHQGLKVVVLFEGRDAAGKGGLIHVSAVSSPCRHPQREKLPSGISSVTCPIYLRPARWCFLTAAGTTGPVSKE
jgi:hypothetical protein